MQIRGADIIGLPVICTEQASTQALVGSASHAQRARCPPALLPAPRALRAADRSQLAGARPAAVAAL